MFIHLQEGIHIKGLKMCKITKHEYHSTQSPKEEAHNQENQGLQQVDDKPKIQPNQPNSTQHHHGLGPGNHKRSHNEIGLKVGHPGCGCTPQVAPSEPNLVWSVHTDIPKAVH